MSEFSLESHGLTVRDIRRNLAPARLYAEAVREEPDCVIADSGALVAYSHDKTGRSPKDKRVVRHPDTAVWWGAVNIPIGQADRAVRRELRAVRSAGVG
jgi:phosphoenolpyruvate carboxykinase (ATP)